MGQRGFGHILVLLGILIIFGAATGYYFTIFKKSKIVVQNTVTASDVAQETATPAGSIASPPQEPKESPAPIILRKTYTNPDFGFSFVYPAVLSVQNDTEEDYFKRGGGDSRANFSGYVKYPPEKVLSAVSVLGRDLSFENSIFTIWIFENPNNLSADDWFNKYWYYPFLWGVFDRTSKGHIVPDQEASVSGQTIKYKIVAYQQGSPEYFYFPKGNKMFLFRLESSDSTAEHILETLKFTD